MSIVQRADEVGSDHRTSLVIRQPYLTETRSAPLSCCRLDLLELAMKIVAFVCLSIAALLLILGDLAGLAAVEARLGLSGSLGLLGFLLYVWASRGLISELHIDSTRFEIRLGSRDGHGHFHLDRVFPFDEIVSVFIRRSRNADAIVSLYVKTLSDKAPLKIVRGTERSLVPILEYIADQHAVFRQQGANKTTRTRRLIHSQLH